MRHARRFGTVWNFNNWYVPVAFVASAMVLTVETAQTRAVVLVEETSVVTAAEQQNLGPRVKNTHSRGRGH
ncbi:MAG: hypothetical protein CM1200mP25_1790 [Acidobacteriota bacterium]|nr:MAG: hypothetical protein CM1200mP25_1790 [Acidobacteriota bacterium]